jgi:hypothetical protein
MESITLVAPVYRPQVKHVLGTLHELCPVSLMAAIRSSFIPILHMRKQRPKEIKKKKNN